MPDLDFAFLCEHVRQDPQGVLHALAIGSDTIAVATVPAIHTLGIAIRVTFTANECGRPHRLEIIIQNEDGRRIGQATSTATPVHEPSLPTGWPDKALVGVNVPVPLPSYGMYSIEILIDDHSHKSLQFRVIPSA